MKILPSDSMDNLEDEAGVLDKEACQRDSERAKSAIAQGIGAQIATWGGINAQRSGPASVPGNALHFAIMRNALVMSEVIGRPVSMRRGRRG